MKGPLGDARSAFAAEAAGAHRLELEYLGVTGPDDFELRRIRRVRHGPGRTDEPALHSPLLEPVRLERETATALPTFRGSRLEDPFIRITRRFARTHGPFPTRRLQERYLVDPLPALRELEREGELARGELRPGGTERGAEPRARAEPEASVDALSP